MNINDQVVEQVFYQPQSDMDTNVWHKVKGKLYISVLNELHDKVWNGIRVELRNEIFYHLEEHEYQ